MQVVRKMIDINEDQCDGCGQCILACAEGALELVDGKVKVISDNLCDGLGACIGECPTGALKIIDREAEEFDETAVEAHLKKRKTEPAEAATTLPCGCPSIQLQVFENVPKQETGPHAETFAEMESALGHWPVKIRLVPPTAPFLKGADLLVMADCVPVAFPMLHRDFLKGRAVTMGCPKFDNAQEYIDKFADIFKTAGIKSITCVVMEVPCCAGLPKIVEKGLETSGMSIPMERVVISIKGAILRRIKG